ncbi:hypothetical protein CDL15_Pgr016630 [Punica granatum]|uniref:Peptidyl-prolyl cis-trans isomerase n=1 Tax=Punica granatum TaxID=22663 RepID=A0A218XSQ3_PUNGR|nr:hypothetical protein CDL15_Pgr016630 [Punica granatum]
MARIKPQTLLLQSKKKKGPNRISIATIILYALIIGLISLSMVATFRHWSRRSMEQTGVGLKNSEPEVHESDVHDELSRQYDLPGYAILSTSKGDIKVELSKDVAPGIVDKFLDLCQKGEFKGIPFQHVIKNYLIRGGKSRAGAAESWISEGKLRTQLVPRRKHDAFMLGTSKKGLDDKSFDLIITTASIPDFDDKLIMFGRVIGGENVVKYFPMELMRALNFVTSSCGVRANLNSLTG